MVHLKSATLVVFGGVICSTETLFLLSRTLLILGLEGVFFVQTYFLFALT